MNDHARLLHLATLTWPPAHRVSVATAEGRVAFVRMAVSRGLAPVTLAQLHLPGTVPRKCIKLDPGTGGAGHLSYPTSPKVMRAAVWCVRAHDRYRSINDGMSDAMPARIRSAIESVPPAEGAAKLDWLVFWDAMGVRACCCP